MSTWIASADADTYFSLRLGASAYWKSGADKEAALATAQWQIENCDLFAWYTDVSVSGVSATQAMADAVCEQALFLLMDADVDRRAALQAQGVTRQDVLGETYTISNGIAICNAAYACMKKAGYLKHGLGFKYTNNTDADLNDLT